MKTRLGWNSCLSMIMSHWTGLDISFYTTQRRPAYLCITPPSTLSLIVSMATKNDLAVPFEAGQPRQRRFRHLLLASLLIALIPSLIFWSPNRLILPLRSCAKHDEAPPVHLPRCPAQQQVAPSARPDISEKNVNGLFKSDDFRKLSVERLAGAVQIPTVTYQDMGKLGEDKRWDAHYKLEDYFKKTFPLL